MDFEQRKEIVLQETKKLYDKYSKKGLLSIYWYGSGLNEGDFNENSDIDLIAIAENRFNFDYEQEMIDLLNENTELDLRIRILYLSELNGGEFKGLFVTYLPLPLWLINFNDYLYLFGRKFHETDFKIKKANFKEAMKIQKEMYLVRKENFLEDNSKAMYFVKSPLHYLYYLCCSEEGYFSFSYEVLKEKVPEKYFKLLNGLLEIKNSNYDIEKIMKLLSEIDELME